MVSEEKIAEFIGIMLGDGSIGIYDCKFKDKIKTTNLQKYGFTSYLKTAEFKQKCKQTSLKKYGVEHTLQSKEIIEKIKKTNIIDPDIEPYLSDKSAEKEFVKDTRKIF